MIYHSKLDNSLESKNEIMAIDRFNIRPLPAPIPLSCEFWDFIEQNLPYYHTRSDVLRQSELQMFIDGHDSSMTGITKEDAICERNRILFQIYAESINAFTRVPIVAPS